MRLGTAILAALLPILGSCGQQSPSERIEYYIEERDPGDSGQESPNPNSDDAKAIKLTFNEPTAVDPDGVITISIEVKNVATDASWSLYYSVKQDLSEPITIIEDFSVADSEVDWNTTQLTPGSYFIFASLTSDGITKKYPLNKPIVIENMDDSNGEESPPNQAPIIALDFPLGENVFVAGAPQDIRWTASDSNNDQLSFQVEYSADGGNSWTMIAQNLTATNYAWDVTGLTQGITYRVRVTAEDGRGGSVIAMSPRNFGVATQPMTFAAGFGAMLAQRCGNCHATGRPNQAQFRSDNFALANIGVNAKKNNIKNRIEANTMPPGGNGLGAADKAVVTMWLWSGGQ